MSAPPADQRLTRHRSFVLFWCARTSANGAYMMQGVAVGWQIYDLTNDPLDLGLVGLMQFFPLLVLSPVAGQLLDLFDRRLVAALCQSAKALCALALAVGTLQGWLGREAMFLILVVAGAARTFEIPTMHALLPNVVTPALLPRAIAASASAQQTAVICGPSLGGLLYALGPAVVYLICTAAFLAAALLLALVATTSRVAQAGGEARKPVTVASMLAGFRYVLAQPVLLGAISLDLFAMLLGGVTALLPIYARDILHAGPWALGLLRSAPAIGALLMSVVLAHRAIAGRAGHIMFAAVGVFGLASLTFALSASLPVSLVALAVYGGADSVSVVIRQSLIQLRTPDEMMGRVTAVNSMFTGSSGALGEFRAGTVAAWLGAVPSALIGGAGALVVMAVWMWAFPQLRRVDKLAAERRP
ncbi:MAG: MFS transporter [Hyphomicrobiales bacterium]|nr:MFS transporter [Hyphomicrobiales bacterium]